jgi:hypothetical protein
MSVSISVSNLTSKLSSIDVSILVSKAQKKVSQNGLKTYINVVSILMVKKAAK